MEDKTELVDQMKIVLATVFSFYLKAHNYHWNVTGPNFSEYHTFFGEIYETVHGSVDEYAERIRVLGGFAPGSLKRFSELTKISCEVSIPSAKFMLNRLLTDNEVLIDELKTTINLAKAEHGLLNFLEAQLDYHEKLAWKLRSFE